MHDSDRRVPSLPPIAFLLAAAAFASVEARAQRPETLRERGSTLHVVEPDEAERDLRMTPVVRAVQRTADSVVSIYLQAENQLAGRGPVTEGQGSGVILDDNGLVITNWHVVAPVVAASQAGAAGPAVEVKLRDGRAFDAQVLSSSAARDLALLQLHLPPGEKVKPADIGRSADLMIGETVIAIGNPQGHANTVTSGVLSATGRTIQVRDPFGNARSYSDLLQTDAAINQGNSGGALLDITGKLIGINSAMAMGAENIGFAIPIDVVREAFERQLLQSSNFAMSASSPWLGFEVSERDGAVVVTDVLRDGPAARAGIAAGDVLLRAGEHPVRGAIDYLRHLLVAKPAQPFPLTLRRGSREIDVAPLATTRVDGTIHMAIGVQLDEISLNEDLELVRKLTIAFYRGSRLGRVTLLPVALRVREVQPGSPAEAIGMQPGDLLLARVVRSRLGERELPIESRTDFAHRLQEAAGRSMKIAILRGDTDMAGTIDVRPLRR